ncbi:hypothetical protein WG628_03585 [Stenotrophomonas maltophilia]
MARGPSGRVVIEVEPDLKKHLYTTLAAKGLTLKDWFINSAEDCIRDGHPSVPNKKTDMSAFQVDGKKG